MKRQTAINACKRIWKKLAINNSHIKIDGMRFDEYDKYYNECPACEYVQPSTYEYNACIKCPIDWGCGTTRSHIINKYMGKYYFNCENHKAAYYKWRTARTKKSRRFWANRIANLPILSVEQIKQRIKEEEK